MKLYEFAPTPSSRRVSIFLKELDFEVERVQVNVREGENLSEEYKAKSVNGKVPMLELDNGVTICESVAICRYFHESVPNKKNLFGETILEKAQVEMWHRVVEFQGLYTGFQALRNISGVYKDRENCVEEWGIESKKRVEEFLPQLDQRLANSSYVATEALTIVDITAFVFVGFAEKILQLDVLSQYANIARWFNELAERPSFQ